MTGRVARDKRGMSLIELVVAFALLAIVSLIMLGLMVASGNLYRRVSDDISLQLQSQIVMAQIREYVVDANGTIAFDGAALTIRNSDGDHIFTKTGDTITYNGDLLASHVESFDVELTDKTDVGAFLKSVTVSATFARGGDTYSARQVIALRNENVT
ncbi:MAG: type II secretion system GspH family protein [Oscillospiraceae bacterium]|jgi:prepilin-type N-terminal cleavage/methylation domain-containing protein|nr:type II secretion system GspH family protein [Oscillospiraceae bacterium]